MRIVADLHIHSPYSRAVSKDMTLENLDHWARLKGIAVMGTGDFTHPVWMKEIKTKLEPAEEGLYRIRNKELGIRDNGTRFLLTVEVSSIYSKNGKTRRIHNLIFAPSIETAEKINAALGWRGNLKSDGRPILGLDSRELAKIVLEIDPNAMIVPAHCLLPSERIHTGNGVKAIQDIKKGDYVFTHQGRLRRVEDVSMRSYQGITFRVRPWYFRPGLETTPEHPFFAIKTQKHCRWQRGFCRPGCSGRSHCCKRHRAEDTSFQPQWIQAKDLEVSDALVFPRCANTQDIGSLVLSDTLGDQEEKTLSIFHTRVGGSLAVTLPGTRSRIFANHVAITKEFCRLAGYFVAEGSVNGRDALSFTFAKHEREYSQDVKRLMRSSFGIPCAKEREKGGSIEYIFYSKILQSVFASLFYSDAKVHRAYTKTLPQWALFLPLEKQAEILKGWWRGDAGYTVSRELMNQMKILSLRLGIIPSIVTVSHTQANKGRHVLDGRVIHANHDLFQFSGLAFFEDACGLRNDPLFQDARFCPKLNRRHGWIDERFIYIPIRDIEQKEYKGTVYNLEVDEDHSYLAEFAAVHNCWTPWFSLFGSMSGFDSVEECFEDYAKHIRAVETGLSSDPAMNWRVSQLDQIGIISNSDSHSLPRIGREANVFDTELSYGSIVDAMTSRDPKKFLFTIEFYPEEGKYHYDGHRQCNFSASPEETKQHKGVCPVCGKPVTVGVLNRVEKLADRPAGFRHAGSIPYKSLVPLDEIIAEAFGMGTSAKKVKDEYQKLVAALGTEFAALVDASRSDLAAATAAEVVEGIMRVREGRLRIEPGYDGEYGKVKIFAEGEARATPQAGLF